MAKLTLHPQAFRLKDGRGAQGPKAFTLGRCDYCGLEWETTNPFEGCPMRELEVEFLPLTWLLPSHVGEEIP